MQDVQKLHILQQVQTWQRGSVLHRQYQDLVEEAEAEGWIEHVDHVETNPMRDVPRWNITEAGFDVWQSLIGPATEENPITDADHARAEQANLEEQRAAIRAARELEAGGE